MNCQNHPNKESIANCVICGKVICDECRLNIAGKDYCKECVTEILVSETPKRKLNNETAQNLNDTYSDTKKETYGIKSSDKTKNNIAKEGFSQEKVAENDDLSYKNNSSSKIVYPDKSIEEKYEKYLDDLYHDDKEKEVFNQVYTPKDMSLKEQLAIDEARHGPLIKESYAPVTAHNITKYPNINETEIQSKRAEKRYVVQDNSEYKKPSLHPNIPIHKKEPKDSKSVEIALTIILITLIFLVSFYIIFLLALSDRYISFFDALYSLFINPSELINNILT